MRTRGVNAESRLWRVGIERPALDNQRRITKIISLKDLSVATSGDYRNRYRDDQGVVRSHTIDPRTGEPVKHTLASVSVLHQENIYADAWATALNVLGAEEGLKLAKQHDLMALFIIREQVNAEALDLDRQDTVYTIVESPALKRYLETLD